MSVKKYNIAAFFFILVFGSLLHFTYSLSGQNVFVSYFSAVNESTWEHLKLLFFPAVVFSVFEYFAYGKNRADFWAIKMTSIIAGMLFIVVFFYTYSGVLGFFLLSLDILDFILADFLCCFINYRMFIGDGMGDSSDSIKGISVLLLIGACFVIWTNNPPDLGLFWG